MLRLLLLGAMTAACTRASANTDAGVPDSGSAETCPAATASGFKPNEWIPPAAARDDCSTADIDAYWDACLKPGSLLIQCQQFTANNPSCAGCLSADDATHLGPQRVVAGIVTANASGCIALVLADPSSGGCGAKDQIVRDCASYVCGQCDGGTSCLAQAHSGACSTQHMATCSEVGMAMPCALDEGFEPDFKRIAAVFCASSRAGAD